MCLARPERALRYGVVCTAASVVGGLLGYAVGHFLFATVGTTLLDLLHLTKSFPPAACYLREYGAEIILVQRRDADPVQRHHDHLWLYRPAAVHLPVGQHRLARHAVRAGRRAVLEVRRADQVYLERYLTIISIAFVVLVVGGVLAAGMLTGGSKAGDTCSGATMDMITGS